MDRSLAEEEKMIAELYEASRNGCVSALTTLIQREARILDRVSLTSLSETPLHLAALHGHLEISRLILSKKPTLAKEVDSLRRTPLHLASAEGHIEIVKALLQVNKDVCLASDEHERIPLHYAAMRGRIEIIEELIRAKPVSIQKNPNGGSVLHLCVQYNHLDALELLVKSADCDDLLKSKDSDGNSILHLAVILKQMKTTKYLLSIPTIKREANAMNKIGYTASDVLEDCDVCSKDFKCFEIQKILKEAGVKRSKDLNSSLPPTRSTGTSVDKAQQSRFKRWWKSVCSSLSKRLKRQGNWMEKTRGTLMLVATVMATMSFQAGISPPGGVWQENKNTTVEGFSCSINNICEAGKAVLSYSETYSDSYLRFLYFNSTSFFASLCVILLVITGFPIKSEIFIWLLTSAMLISITSMTFTYTRAVSIITSENLLGKFILSWGTKLSNIWVGSLVIVFVIHIIRLLCWMVKKLIHIIRPLIWIVKKLCNFIHKLTISATEDRATV